MLIGDEAAGITAVECLIEQGKLTPDFWFRVKINHKDDHFSWSDTHDPCDAAVSNAVRFAMGVKDITVPEWLNPDYQLPDCVWIESYEQGDFPTTETYYTARDLKDSLKLCYTGLKLDIQALKMQQAMFKSLSLRAWRRIIPHFSPEISAEILKIENWPGKSYRRHPKSFEIKRQVTGAMIRDGALREFYDKQGNEGLSNIFHGLGQRAVQGIGAMLFHSGEHDDLYHAAEKLEELVSR